MLNKASKRLGDDFYPKEKSKIKYTAKLLIKKINHFKSQNLKIADVGFGNADLLYLIKNKYPKWECIGMDSNSKLIKHAKKKYPELKVYKFDLMSSKIKKSLKSNIVICIGVVQIFDNLKKCINKLINLTKKKGRIYIISIFNPYEVDIYSRYKLFGGKILQLGWNRHSILSLKKYFLENKRIKKISIKKITFPNTLKIKRRKDVMRSWTVKFNKKTHFYNPIGIQYQYFIDVKLN